MDRGSNADDHFTPWRRDVLWRHARRLPQRDSVRSHDMGVTESLRSSPQCDSLWKRNRRTKHRMRPRGRPEVASYRHRSWPDACPRPFHAPREARFDVSRPGVPARSRAPLARRVRLLPRTKIVLDSLARGSDVGLRARSSCALRARRTSSRATNPAADATWLAVLRVRRRPGP